MPFPLFLALKYLRPKRSFSSIVTLISVLGVILGVAIVIIVRAVMTGFGDMWEQKILEFKPHIVLSPLGGTIIHGEEEVCRRLEQVDGVVAATPGLETRVMVEHRRSVVAPILLGVDPKRIAKVMKLEQMLHGPLELEGDSIVVGCDLAHTLRVGIGDEIFVYSPMNLVSKDELYLPERLRITGIFDSGQRDFDSEFVITSLDVARDLMGITSGAYSIHLKADAPQNVKRFSKVVSDVRTLAPSFRVQTWQEVDSQLFNALAVEKNMMVMLLMFITIVAIFCVTNTLIVLTVQKTDEIGLLKALGFSPRQVMMAFVLHGWIQCLIGTVLGVGAAFLVLNNLQNMVDGLARLGVEVFPKSVYGLSEIPWRVIPKEVADVAVSVILFCTVASFIPAWRASRMDPVKALHDS